MRIIAENNELIFKRKDSGEWFSKIPFLSYYLYFTFQDSIFKFQEENVEIDWELIGVFVIHILKNVELINSTGIKAIEDFEKIVRSGDPYYIKENGRFEVDGISLIDFQKTVNFDKSNNPHNLYRFKYNVDFFFETENGYNPEYSYSAQFSNHHSLTIIGVYNNVWSLYK